MIVCKYNIQKQYHIDTYHYCTSMKHPIACHNWKPKRKGLLQWKKFGSFSAIESVMALKFLENEKWYDYTTTTCLLLAVNCVRQQYELL